MAEDLLADTFERAFSSRRAFDRRKGRERTWIYAIALNCCRDHLRRRAAEDRAVSSVTVLRAGQQDRSVESTEARNTVQSALGCLSEEEREAVALRYGADLTVPEIAKLMGLPTSTVDGRVYRSLRKLRAELSP